MVEYDTNIILELKRRLRRLGMKDIDVSGMINTDQTVLEWRIPGELPKEEMDLLASMRQLRSIIVFNSRGSISRFEFRYPTITVGKDDEIGMGERAEFKSDIEKRLTNVMAHSNIPQNTSYFLRGGGGIKMVGWTPHLRHPKSFSEGVRVDEDGILDFLDRSVDRYKEEFALEMV